MSLGHIRQLSREEKDCLSGENIPSYSSQDSGAAAILTALPGFCMSARSSSKKSLSLFIFLKLNYSSQNSSCHKLNKKCL